MMHSCVGGELEEDVLEVRLLDAHLVDHETGGGDRLADLLRGHTAGDDLVGRTELGANPAEVKT